MPDEITKKDDFKHIVRLAEADLKGEKKLLSSLRKVKGVNFTLANAICKVTNMDPHKQVGLLTNEEVKKLDEVIRSPKKFNIFPWLLNRNKDFETGDDVHLIGSELKLQNEFDIKHLKKIKCYRGVRHSQGLPVRGQRTRGNFRSGKTIGVRRKGLKAQAPKEGDKK
tara:strand:+ start:1886 stop:2386 length:501 start_codon:yes stop_codon:yes gene_type:complete